MTGRRDRAAPAIAGALLLAGCERGVLDPAGPVAGSEKLILLDSLGIMLILIVPVILATLAIAWWFRAGNARAKHRPDWAFSGRLELLVWSVPTMIVIFVAGLGWVGSHQLDPARPLDATAPLRVEVVALDWKWLFIYPDQGMASVNRLVVPVGRPIAFRLTSTSVMNSFFVPRLGSQIYAMAGMETRLNLQADKPGSYRGLSANYSGKGFPGMAFTLDAVPPAAFDAWLAQAHQSGPPLDGQGYATLLRDSENIAPYTYRAVAPRLFDAIVKQSGTPRARTATDGRAH
ncbi:MAG: cytochrome ubiquinol oxidase subunit [Bradyrhizobium sp.]|nr:cytochrome ubiquinol oxidase subunit [Bradyrhizobium sp.]